jgi:hypothetical protein
MKQIAILILIILTQKSFGQKSNELERYITAIDKMVYTDSIYLSDSLNGQRVNIIGFEKNDTIYKVELNYPDLNRKRIVYYKKDVNFLNNVCYVREIDSKTSKLYIDVKSWDNNIIKSFTKNVLNKDERKDIKRILDNSDLTTLFEFKKIDDKADKFHLKCSLVEKVALPADCGYFAFAAAFKFKIIETDYKTKEQFLIILIQCPREKGEEFYEPGSIYKIMIATNSGVTFDWVTINGYESEKLPTFWARQIEKMKN